MDQLVSGNRLGKPRPHVVTTKPKTPRISFLFPVLVTAIGVFSSMVLWLEFDKREDALIKRLTQEELDKTTSLISESMSATILALARMGDRWSGRSGTPQAEWQKDAQNYVDHNDNLSAVQWVDNTHHVRWVEPIEGNENVVGLNIAYDDTRKNILDTAQKNNQIILTPPLDLVQGYKAIISYIPIYKQNTFDGFVTGITDINFYFDTLLPESIINPLNLKIYDEGDVVFERLLETNKSLEKWAATSNLKLFNRSWTVKLSPTSVFQKKHQSLLPEVSLLAGTLLSLLIGISVYYAMLFNRNGLRFKNQSDILKANQLSLKNRENFLSTLFENIPDLLFVKDSEFRIVQANAAFLNLYPEDIRKTVIGTTTLEAYDPEDAKEFLKHDQLAFDAGHSETEEHIVFPDGSKRLLFTKKVRFENSTNESFILCIARDITAIVAKETDLKDQGKILEDSLNEIYIFDAASLNFVHLNKGARDNIGYSMTELSQMTPIDIKPEHTEDTFKDITAPLTNGDKDKIIFETRHERKDGSTYDVEIHLQRAQYESKPVYVAIALDITNRLVAEEKQAVLVDKLIDSNEELERFAFVCSHDLQEPLRMIRSFSERLETHLQTELSVDEKGSRYLNFITDGAERAQQLIADILAYSRVNHDTDKMEVFEVNGLVDVVAKDLSERLDEIGGQLTHDDLPSVSGNKAQIFQLLQNLIHNGIKYRAEGAKPHVHVSALDLGDFYQFEVRDNGIGINKKHTKKIFEVFQRLHGRGEYTGTGIGLSICKKITERHGGKIWVSSELGKGSSFFFTLRK